MLVPQDAYGQGKAARFTFLHQSFEVLNAGIRPGNIGISWTWNCLAMTSIRMNNINIVIVILYNTIYVYIYILTLNVTIWTTTPWSRLASVANAGAFQSGKRGTTDLAPQDAFGD